MKSMDISDFQNNTLLFCNADYTRYRKQKKEGDGNVDEGVRESKRGKPRNEKEVGWSEVQNSKLGM